MQAGKRECRAQRKRKRSIHHSSGVVLKLSLTACGLCVCVAVAVYLCPCLLAPKDVMKLVKPLEKTGEGEIKDLI